MYISTSMKYNYLLVNKYIKLINYILIEILGESVWSGQLSYKKTPNRLQCSAVQCSSTSTPTERTTIISWHWFRSAALLKHAV
jgi:hypothetical protein